MTSPVLTLRRVCGQGVGWRRVEDGDIRGVGAGGMGHAVVEVEDDALRAIFTVHCLVLLPNDREGVKDVGSVVMGKAIEVEEGSATPGSWCASLGNLRRPGTAK